MEEDVGVEEEMVVGLSERRVAVHPLHSRSSSRSWRACVVVLVLTGVLTAVGFMYIRGAAPEVTASGTLTAASITAIAPAAAPLSSTIDQFDANRPITIQATAHESTKSGVLTGTSVTKSGPAASKLFDLAGNAASTLGNRPGTGSPAARLDRGGHGEEPLILNLAENAWCNESGWPCRQNFLVAASGKKGKAACFIESSHRGKHRGRDAERITELGLLLSLAQRNGLEFVNLPGREWRRWFHETFQDHPNLRFGPNDESFCAMNASKSSLYRSPRLYAINPWYLSLQLKPHHWHAAEQAAASIGVFASVHREYKCKRTRRNHFCSVDSGIDYSSACLWDESGIRTMLSSDSSELQIVLFTDAANPELDATFSHIDHHPFPVQLAMMTLSNVHFGNPMSNIDYVVAHWRGPRADTRPASCFHNGLWHRPAQKLFCLIGRRYGGTFNQVIAIAHAMRQAKMMNATLALSPKTYAKTYRALFEPRVDVLLRHDCGSSETGMNGSAAYYAFERKRRDSVLEELVRNSWRRELLNSAHERISDLNLSLGQQLVTVHHRWLEGSCFRRARRHKTFCEAPSQDFSRVCTWTQDDILEDLAEASTNAFILELSDSERPKDDSTFAHTDNSTFLVDTTLMMLSDIHYGNPMSSVDYVVAHSRSENTRPESCWLEGLRKRTMDPNTTMDHPVAQLDQTITLETYDGWCADETCTHPKWCMDTNCSKPRFHIFEASPPHTASTLLVNMLYGFLCADKPVAFSRPAMPFYSNCPITKTHEIDLNKLWNHNKNRFQDVYFVSSQRNGLQIQRSASLCNRNRNNPKFRVLCLEYDAFVYHTPSEMRHKVKFVADALQRQFPQLFGDAVLDVDSGVARCMELDRRAAEVAEKPFKYHDRFFQVHGHHKNRTHVFAFPLCSVFMSILRGVIKHTGAMSITRNRPAYTSCPVSVFGTGESVTSAMPTSTTNPD